MNSNSGAGHVRKQSFQEDEYRAFRIALDVKETEIEEFWKNIDELKSKKEFLRIRENLQSKILRKKNTLKDKNSNYVEKGVKGTTRKAERTISPTGENEGYIVDPKDAKEIAPLIGEKDSESKEKSTGAVRKINQKKTKKAACQHTSITDATNMMNSGSNEVRKKVRKSKDTRVLAEKENLATSQETAKMMEEAPVKRGKKNIKRKENVLNNVANDSGEEYNGRNENPKRKSKWMIQLKEKENPIKQNENNQNEGKSLNILDIKEKDTPKDKESEKKKKVSKKNKENDIEKKTPVRKLRPRKKNDEKTQDVPEIDGKDFGGKEAELKKKKTRAKKTMLLKEGEEETSKPRIKGNAGNEETETKKSKIKRNKAAEDKNAENVVLQRKKSAPPKSGNYETVENTSTEVTENIKSDNELMKTNSPDAQSEIPKTMTNNSKEVNQLRLNDYNQEEGLSSKKQLECTEFIKPVTLENIDQEIFKKLNLVYNDLKNEECDFQSKSFEKPSLEEIMENPYLFEEKNHKPEDDKPLEDLKKYSASCVDKGNKCEKPERMKTLHELKQEVKQKVKELRYEKKLAKAVEKLSLYTLKHLKKLDSNSALKHHLGLKLNSDSDSETSWESEDSSEDFCSECSCSSACSCSCCSDSESYYDSKSSSSSCSCSNCCSSSSYYSATSNSSDSSDSNSD